MTTLEQRLALAAKRMRIRRALEVLEKSLHLDGDDINIRCAVAELYQARTTVQEEIEALEAHNAEN